MALWPMVTPVPILSGKPISVCITVPSCTLLFSPIWISSLSPRSTALNHTLAPGSSLTLPTRVAFGATQLSAWASTWDEPRRYFMDASSISSGELDKVLGRLMHIDMHIVEHQVDQLDQHDRRQPPDFIFAIAVTRHIPAAPEVINTVVGFPRVVAKERQRHGKYGGNLTVVGLVLDKVRHQADIRGDLNTVARHQGT